MYTENALARVIQDECVAGAGKSVEQIAAAAREVMEKNRICLIRAFPLDPDRYLEFLGHFGEPLMNYSSLSELAKTDPHPQINRVKYKKKAEGAQSVHYVAGGLRPHSARSWRSPRPSHFAMLMVEAGWREVPAGERGESVVVSWNDLFNRLAERDGEAFQEHFARLSTTPITFEANNVREELSRLPLLYRLPDARGPYDVGVRLKQDLSEKIVGIREQIPDFEAYQKSLDYLLEASADEQFFACFPMASGDLLLLDNHRFAHGRLKIVGEYVVDGEARTNNRELWSVTVSPRAEDGAAAEADGEQADLVAVCAELQGELDALIGGTGSNAAAQSLDTAVASLKEVEQRNVSSVQLVALSHH
ncbi:TauD/TfdA family dioxygenase [Streptomyces sp. ISL-100]|uniref:TauD/TfdA family dioxygenase n=1 Tax=Streptomyces sp. ISL-100 TaxID=2819173 RepID=UPI001BE9109A|nr:TauD/TfdA family dioxygenase [Streptomyces sp. ISL-100]MBT2399357.1 TauD/TfdA family dioxygenase [Streptomyces sp. ISL-100]